MFPKHQALDIVSTNYSAPPKRRLKGNSDQEAFAPRKGAQPAGPGPCSLYAHLSLIPPSGRHILAPALRSIDLTPLLSSDIALRFS